MSYEVAFQGTAQGDLLFLERRQDACCPIASHLMEKLQCQSTVGICPSDPFSNSLEYVFPPL